MTFVNMYVCMTYIDSALTEKRNLFMGFTKLLVELSFGEFPPNKIILLTIDNLLHLIFHFCLYFLWFYCYYCCLSVVISD